MTLRHITAAEVRHQQRERERVRERTKLEREREGKEPQPKEREEETGISSMIEFDTATSSNQTLLINHIETEKGKIEKTFNFAIKKIKTIFWSQKF